MKIWKYFQSRMLHHQAEKKNKHSLSSSVFAKAMLWLSPFCLENDNLLMVDDLKWCRMDVGSTLLTALPSQKKEIEIIKNILKVISDNRKIKFQHIPDILKISKGSVLNILYEKLSIPNGRLWPTTKVSVMWWNKAIGVFCIRFCLKLVILIYWCLVVNLLVLDEQIY